MDHQEYMSVWKKNCIRIGSPTNILAALTAFIEKALPAGAAIYTKIAVDYLAGRSR